jgi:hypothetical protein
VASDYAPVGDVDPRIGEHLLDVLGAARIAAYLQPSTDMHPITRTTSLPSRPTDRLFVDREHLATAQEYLRQVTVGIERVTATERESTPDRETADRETAGDRDKGGAGDAVGPDRMAGTELDGPDVDAAWQQIVAGFHVTIDPTDPPWPQSEELANGAPRLLPHIEAATEPPPEPRLLRRAEPAEPSLLDALDTFGATLPADDDEGYTPPPPPPLPRISAAAGMGVAAIAFGLLLFVWPGLLPLDGDTVLVLAFGAIVAGFGTLIWRLRPGDDDDDLDDGARV